MYLVEAKTRISDPDAIRRTLAACGAVLESRHRHTDIYFTTPMGPFKLREAERGSFLMFKQHPRPDMDALVQYDIEPIVGAARVGALLTMMGKRKALFKEREVYALGQATVHLDAIRGLGDFLEIEVRVPDPNEAMDRAMLCRDCMCQLGLNPADFRTTGYDRIQGKAA